MLLGFGGISDPHSGIIRRETPSPGLDPNMLRMPRFLEGLKGPARVRSWPWNRTLPAPFQEIVPPSLGAQKTKFGYRCVSTVNSYLSTVIGS